MQWKKVNKKAWSFNSLFPGLVPQQPVQFSLTKPINRISSNSKPSNSFKLWEECMKESKQKSLTNPKKFRAFYLIVFWACFWLTKQGTVLQRSQPRVSISKSIMGSWGNGHVEIKDGDKVKWVNERDLRIVQSYEEFEYDWIVQYKNIFQ